MQTCYSILAHFVRYNSVSDLNIQVTAAALSPNFLDFASFPKSGRRRYGIQEVPYAPSMRVLPESSLAT